MRVPTQDPNLLAACLERFMANTESHSLRDQADVLADRLNAMSPPAKDAIVDAQLFLQRHGVECPGSNDL